ncbi:MAG: ferrochelatase [Halobacteria archaeon]
MSVGVILLNFGEPEEANQDAVVDYLEEIFYSNMELEGEMPEKAAKERARELAERRAPGLIEEYEEIGGGSPLIPQAREQAMMLEQSLDARGVDAKTYIGMQFTDPFVHEAVEKALDTGVDSVVGMPVYPLCGETTTIESLEKMEEAVEDYSEDTGADIGVWEVTGWHRHPTYLELRREQIRNYGEENEIDLSSEDTAMVFSAHGTPTKYLEDVRYVTYVEDFCETVAERLGLSNYHIGYQNHENRDVEWTEPSVEELVEELDVGKVVIDTPSFMHEQSETLSELDIDLREDCQEQDIEYHRVPVPYDDPRLGEVFADLVEPLVNDTYSATGLTECDCKDASEPLSVCLNSGRFDG